MQDDEQLHSIVFFLSDHLYAVLETGKSILKLRYKSTEISSEMSTEEILLSLDEFQRFLNQIRHYEYLLVTRISQARHWATQLRFLDNEFRPVLDLFNASTNIVSDAIEVLGQDDEALFHGAEEPYEILRSRGLNILSTHADGQPAEIVSDNNFLVGGTVPVMEILTVCTTLLETLETRYAIDVEPDNEAEADIEEEVAPSQSLKSRTRSE